MDNRKSVTLNVVTLNVVTVGAGAQPSQKFEFCFRNGVFWCILSGTGHTLEYLWNVCISDELQANSGRSAHGHVGINV